MFSGVLVLSKTPFCSTKECGERGGRKGGFVVSSEGGGSAGPKIREYDVLVELNPWSERRGK
jgi:hypothetical protein